MYGAGILLLAAIGGYWVLERAQGHRGNLKRIGQLVGGVVIIVSLLGVSCKVYGLATGKSYSKCSKRYYCPYAAKQAASTPASPSK